MARKITAYVSKKFPNQGAAEGKLLAVIGRVHSHIMDIGARLSLYHSDPSHRLPSNGPYRGNSKVLYELDDGAIDLQAQALGSSSDQKYFLDIHVLMRGNGFDSDSRGLASRIIATCREEGFDISEDKAGNGTDFKSHIDFLKAQTETA